MLRDCWGLYQSTVKKAKRKCFANIIVSNSHKPSKQSLQPPQVSTEWLIMVLQKGFNESLWHHHLSQVTSGRQTPCIMLIPTLLQDASPLARLTTSSCFFRHPLFQKQRLAAGLQLVLTATYARLEGDETTGQGIRNYVVKSFPLLNFKLELLQTKNPTVEPRFVSN